MKEEKKGKIRWWLVIVLTLIYFMILTLITIPIGIAVFEFKYQLYKDPLDALMTAFIACALVGVMTCLVFTYLMNNIIPLKGGMKDEKWKDSMNKKKTGQKQTRKK